MPVSIRAAVPEDAEACGPICYEAFRTIAEKHGFPPDFPSPDVAVGVMTMFLSRPDVHAVVAECDGRVIGSNFLWENCPIAGIGPITVDPAAQDSGAGALLMEAVLSRVREKQHPGVRLVQSAYHSRSLALYTRLGFDARAALSIVNGPPIGLEIPGYRVRNAADEDIDACSRLCTEVHGHHRRGEIADAIELGSAMVVEHDGEITGYTTSVGFFGHSVGRTNTDLKALVAAAPGFAGLGFLLPTLNSELLRWCLARRLRIVQPMTLMSRGLYNEPAGAYLPSVIF